MLKDQVYIMAGTITLYYTIKFVYSYFFKSR